MQEQFLEKHLSLSKAKDGEYSLGSPSYWRKYIYNNSTNIFGGGAPAGIVTTSFGAGATNFTLSGDVGWDQNAQGIEDCCHWCYNTYIRWW